MPTVTRRRFFGLAALTSFAGSLLGKEKKTKRNRNGQRSGPTLSIGVFVGEDRRIISDWVQGVPTGSLPPGLARQGSLAPGLEKQLVRRGTLPPGLQKKLTPFPAELNDRLPPLREELGRFFIEGRAVILNRNTRGILDVFLLF